MKLYKIIILCTLPLLLSACGSTASEEILPGDTTIAPSEDALEDDSESENDTSTNRTEIPLENDSESDSDGSVSPEHNTTPEEDTSGDPSDTQTENPQEQKNESEADNDSLKGELATDDCSIVIGDIVLSLNESKEDILTKLKEAGLEYDEAEDPKKFRARMRATLKESGLEYDKYKEPEEEKYDSWGGIDAWLQLYFLDDVCVRLRLIDVFPENLNPQTTRGLYPGDHYTQIFKLYGDSYETHSSYSKAGIYTTFRYFFDGYVCEFGIPTPEEEELRNADSYSIYNIDIYLPNQMPIYESGPEAEKPF